MKTTEATFQGNRVPVTAANTVIIGAGAAAMNCAVKLVEFWLARGVTDAADRVVVVTGGLSLGASRMSGSDKQTYYKMGTSPRVADTAAEFAKSLTGFGCCHGDTALVEGIASLRGFYHLVEVGVPFPHDPWGAFIGYKTDHDPYERATSAGPKTSRFMSECLEAKARRFGVRIIDKHPVVRFLPEGEGPGRRIRAVVCIDRARAQGDDAGLSVFVAENFVLAAGGPGEVYQTTVYPRGQYGIHAPAFLAGLEAVNLTESQYGLASTKFRWNVSGTYMQAVPRIYSTDADGGDEREFLTEYFPDMPTMATNVFLKGYQWPFDAQRITDHQSTLVDMAVHVETVVRGRRVWMDFLRNPVGAEGWDTFAIDAMGPEAVDYLDKTAARQDLPIERLKHMNPPAIAIYAENGIDLTGEPLEIAVCAQHMNGGFAVNAWWESTVEHTFVIGEMAGTHGVKRPGGSALNAGQVGGSRAAEYITGVYGDAEPDAPVAKAAAEKALAEDGWETLLLAKRGSATRTPEAIMAEIGERMTRHGAHLRSREGAASALDAAAAQYRRLTGEGIAFDSAEELPQAVVAIQQCLTQVALLRAIGAMFDRGAGSRGSHCILDPAGIDMHPKLIDPETGAPMKFKPENEALRNEIVQLAYSGAAAELFDTTVVTPRPTPQRDIAFEPAWAEYREGTIYDV
jgi:succinate dehydrogenase/fumarate reductase flavoprotein subunit